MILTQRLLIQKKKKKRMKNVEISFVGLPHERNIVIKILSNTTEELSGIHILRRSIAIPRSTLLSPLGIWYLSSCHEPSSLSRTTRFKLLVISAWVNRVSTLRVASLRSFLTSSPFPLSLHSSRWSSFRSRYHDYWEAYQMQSLRFNLT